MRGRGRAHPREVTAASARTYVQRHALSKVEDARQADELSIDRCEWKAFRSIPGVDESIERITQHVGDFAPRERMLAAHRQFSVAVDEERATDFDRIHAEV